jgi:type 1 glutamine amidotransferase
MLFPLLLLWAAAPSAAADPVRVLILSGRNNHDWRSTTPFLRKSLEATGRFDARVTEEPAGLTAATLASYDVIVSDYNGPRLGPGAEKAIDEYVRGGKGIVIVHAADYAFGSLEILGDYQKRTGKFEAPWTDYGKLVGAVWSADDPKTGHGPRRVFEVKVTKRDHPITRGLPATLRASDELYRGFRMTDPIELLAAAFDAPERSGTGKDEPMIWVKPWGKGRVFHTALGHDVAAMMEPAFLAPFLRGVEWTATGDVREPAPAARAQGPRLLVVTGGHPHEPSFYSVFEGYDWNHEFRLDNAFKRDVRKQYDVLVLYNMEQEMAEGARRNLQAFVESGKGVVVLHHAICSFNDWDWYRDLVGARYQIKGREGVKASSYTHDIDLTVVPAVKHPVLARIPEFHIMDEGYKDKWVSPDIQPLLTTVHEKSDRDVAWISPYTKARVAVLQLGHDHMAYENPFYRALLRNAISWSSGKP